MKTLNVVFVSSLIFLSLLLVAGCGSTLTLSQPEYEKAMALFNALSRKDEATLSRLKEMISGAKARSEISAGAADRMLANIEIATKGDWDEATRNMRKLMENQAKDAPANTRPGESRQRHSHK